MAMCALIGSASIAYSIGYGICHDEDDRASLAIAFQSAIDLLLGAFMAQMMFYKGIDRALTDGQRSLFVVQPADRSSAIEDFCGRAFRSDAARSGHCSTSGNCGRRRPFPGRKAGLVLREGSFMSDNFNQQCRRRGHTCHVTAQGSGGDPGVQEASGCKYLTAQKDLWLLGNEIHFQTGTSAETPGPYLIEMLAIDSGGDNGRIEMRGSQAVRISSGVPDGSGESRRLAVKTTNGIEHRCRRWARHLHPAGRFIRMSQCRRSNSWRTGYLYIDGDSGAISITLPRFHYARRGGRHRASVLN